VPDREVAHSVLSLYSSQDNRGTEAAREVEPGFAPFVTSWFNLFKRPGVQSGKAKQENDSMAKHSPAFLKIVNEVKPRIRETNVAEVKRRMDRGDRKFKLVDVREESEFAAGHIPGAMHIGKGVIERDIEQKIPTPSDEIILYCGGGFRSNSIPGTFAMHARSTNAPIYLREHRRRRRSPISAPIALTAA